MIDTITKAAENFSIHQLGYSCEINNDINKTRTLIAYIDVDASSGQKHRVYIAGDKGFAQRVSKVFLEEDESDEETLIDMMLETTNLIVGSAKVLAESNEEGFMIHTPNFEKIDNFNYEYDEVKMINIEQDELIIAIKEIN
jgi:hypothetical protein